MGDRNLEHMLHLLERRVWMVVESFDRAAGNRCEQPQRDRDRLLAIAGPDSTAGAVGPLSVRDVAAWLALDPVSGDADLG